MRGSYPKKDPALLTGHRRHRALKPLDGRPKQAPPPVPTGLLPVTRGHWRMLWGSGLAAVWDRDTDLIGLRRYIENLDSWLRYKQLVRQAPLVKGSKGQVRSNPLAAQVDALEKHLHWTEEQYGLTPVARVRLGYTLGAAGNQLDELHRRITQQDEPPDSQVPHATIDGVAYRPL